MVNMISCMPKIACHVIYIDSMPHFAYLKLRISCYCLMVHVTYLISAFMCQI
jgi:hypothetical protein